MPSVVPGFTSHSSLHLYKYTHDANGNAIVGDEIVDPGPLGGKVCVELQVTVDKHNRVAQSANTVTVRQ